MKPVVEGRVLQALELLPTDLAGLSEHVTSVDIHADFTAAATQRLHAAGVTNAALVTGDAINDWQPEGMFDVLVATGAVSEIPSRWLTWLKPGGRALVVRGQSPAQQATLLTHEGAGRYRQEVLFETDLPYLKHAEPRQHFVF